MRNSTAVGCTLSAFAAIAILAGCSSGSWQTAAIPATTVPKSAVKPSFIDPDADGKPLIFVSVTESSNYFVNIYQQRRKNNLVGQITDLAYAQGLATDINRNLYIADTYGPNVLVYPPPYDKVALTITAATNQEPVGVAVSSQGLVAVTNFSTTPSSTLGTVTFYAKGMTKACATVSNSGLPRPVFDGFDAKGNLYVDGGPGFGSGTQIGEVTGGCNAKKIRLLSTNNTITAPGSIKVDKQGRIAILQQSIAPVVIYTYNPPKKGSLGAPVSTTPLTGLDYGLGFAFRASGADLYAADSSGHAIDEYAYPAGGAAIKTFAVTGGFPEDVAVTPPFVP